MKDENERIERLLQHNTDEQLADFDWEQLSAAISSRVSEVEKQTASKSKYRIVLKVAAGIAAAVAIVVVAVTIQRKKSPTQEPVIRLHDSGTAVVKLIGRSGSASVEIEHAISKAYAMVAIGPGDKRLAKCDIEVIDSNGNGKAGDRRAAWIIISRPEPMYADDGFSKDIKDMICLF